MANLNAHDLVFLDSPEFQGFKDLLELSYGFEITSTALPNIISFTSKKTVLTTNQGTYFLKEKPAYCSDPLSLRKSAHFQEYASSKMEIVPKILKTKKSEYFVLWNERYYFLADYIEGRHYNGSSNDIDSMVSALLSFQSCGAQYLTEYQNERSDELRLNESCVVADGIPSVERYVQSEYEAGVYKTVIELQQKLYSQYSKITAQNYIMSHSDFILFNLLLNSESAVIAINDFDNVKVLPRIHDMAEFLVSASLLNYLAPLTNLKFPVSVHPDASVFNQILDRYSSDLNLTDSDWSHLGIVTELVWLWTLVLAVFKGDYSLADLVPALQVLTEEKIQTRIASKSLNTTIHNNFH